MHAATADQQALGRRPSIIRLMYLRDGIIIEARPTERSVRFLPKRTEAVWRAIARACAQNRLAVIVPCHRIVRGDGSLGGYRWGLPRKEALLKSER